MAAPLGIALGSVVSKWIHEDALSEGRRWADKFLEPLPKAVRDKFRDPLAQARRSELEQPLLTVRDRGAGGLARGRVPTSLLAPVSAADKRKAAAEAFNEGWLIGKATAAGLAGVKLTSAPILVRDFSRQLGKLRAQARPEAAKVMIEFAEGLRAQGKLPKKSVDSIIASLEQQVPSLGKYLYSQGLITDRDFAKALKFNAASKQLASTLADYRTKFGDFSISTKITGDNIDQNVALAMKNLRASIAGSSGKARQQYQDELDKMQHSTNQTYGAMESRVESSAHSMRKSIENHTKGAKQAAIDNFAKFQSAVYDGMASGVLSTSKGADLIAKALNTTLDALGVKGKDIPITKIDPTLPRAVKDKSTGGAAQGALVQFGHPGEAGNDSIPVTMGGVSLVVAPGETGAILTRHHRADLDRQFASEGGFAGYLANRRRPNFMAGGGVVVGGKTSTFGPPTEGAGTTASGVSDTTPGISLHIPGTHFSDPQNRALMGHMFNVQIGGHQANLPDIDLGPADFVDRAIDVTGAGAQKMGINPFNFPTDSTGTATLIGNAMGLTGGVAAGAGAALLQMIQAPHVKGTGRIADITRSVLDKLTKEANKYVQDNAPVSTAGGGAGSFTFQDFTGKLPVAVQKALQVATYEVGRHIPYGTGQFGAYYGVNAPSMDCSGFVSTVLNAAGFPGGHMLTGDLKSWGEAGPGKYITVGVLGADSGPTGHTMMEIANRYFESGGGGGGPHEDQGWSSNFPWKRHPRGLAQGGIVRHPKSPVGSDITGYPGHQPTREQLRKDQQSGLTMALGGLLSNATISGGATATMSPLQQSFLNQYKKKKHKPKAKHKSKHRNKGLTLFQHHRAAPKGTIGKGGPFPFDDTEDLMPINAALGRILDLDGGQGGSLGGGGDTQKQSDAISWFSNLWSSALYPSPNFSSWSSPGDFVITQDDAGNPVHAHVAPSLPQVIKELQQILGFQGTWVSDMQQALIISRKVSPMLKIAMNRRAREIEKIKRRIEANLRRIKELQKKIAAERLKQSPFGPNAPEQLPYRHPKNKKQRDANDAYRKARAKHTFDKEKANRDFTEARRKKIAGWTAEITGLKDQNQFLGGDRTKVGSGGELNTIQTQLGAPNEADPITAIGGGGGSSTGLTQTYSTVQDWIALLTGNDASGSIKSQKLQFDLYKSGLSALFPGVGKSLWSALVSEWVAAGTADTGATTTGTTPDNSALVALLEQKNLILTQQDAVSKAQFDVFKNLPPFAGVYHEGGVVPGPIGAERLALVKGGEEYLGPNERGPRVRVEMHDHRTKVFVDDIEQTVDERTRVLARGGNRPMPGRAGGALGLFR